MNYMVPKVPESLELNSFFVGSVNSVVNHQNYYFEFLHILNFVTAERQFL